MSQNMTAPGSLDLTAGGLRSAEVDGWVRSAAAPGGESESRSGITGSTSVDGGR